MMSGALMFGNIGSLGLYPGIQLSNVIQSEKKNENEKMKKMKNEKMKNENGNGNDSAELPPHHHHPPPASPLHRGAQVRRLRQGI